MQARASYQTTAMLHPLVDWMPWVAPGALGFEEERGGNGGQAKLLTLSLALCTTPNVRVAAQAVLSTMPRPARPPSIEGVERPIWTTWARYKVRAEGPSIGGLLARYKVAN